MINNHLFPPLIGRHFIFITIFCILIVIPTSYSDDDEQYVTCSSSYNFSCPQSTELNNISYPFWGGDRPSYCGRHGFELKCHPVPGSSHPIIETAPQKFLVINIITTNQTMRIARDDLNLDSYNCPRTPESTTFNPDLFSYSPNVRTLSLFYDCNDGFLSGTNNYSCQIGSEERKGFYIVDNELKNFLNLTPTCKEVIKIPILRSSLDWIDHQGGEWLREALIRGFDVKYEAADNSLCSACVLSGGICGSNESNLEEFVCLCRDKPRPHTCPDRGSDLNMLRKIIIAVSCTAFGMIVMAIVFFICVRRYKRKNAPLSYVSRSIYSNSSSVVDTEKGDKIPGVQLFTYEELEEATHNFDSTKELGDGGFGTVYYGKLKDGRSVAVKRLYENNCKRVEQFMNEIEILAKLRHQNLVSLYGCTSRHSRELLLVYDYIPNGTVADHLHGERAKPGGLPWATRLKIATQTASALAYLHASDIIHRDVKTNNILLDNNFSVKVADFGLSRLFPTNVTHVSTAPQGTPGYVDPEYHQCYQLTDKSDVFSFGVVLIELISSKPAVDITRHRHEINLSNMAINKIQNKALHELVDPTLGFESDYKVGKMINSVAELAFQCLQSEKDMRPYMADVVETLKGIQSDGYNKVKAEEMEIPSDDIGLLQSGSQSVSPDSVTFRWTSTKTTPNAST